MNEEITVLILTHNLRHKYLDKSLKYFSEHNQKVIVVDNSINKYKNKYKNVKYYQRWFSYSNRLFFGINKVKTKYCVLCGDDDFLDIKGLNNCKRFLDLNPNYSSARGQVYAFIKDNDAVYFRDIYSRLSYKENRMVDRVFNYIREYTTPLIYCLFRTEDMKNLDCKGFRNIDESDNDYLEVLFSILLLKCGKSRFIKTTYLFREKEIFGTKFIKWLRKGLFLARALNSNISNNTEEDYRNIILEKLK